MANMSYCRFQNTVRDLSDCEDSLFDELEKGGQEEKARARLVKICHMIAEQCPLDEIENLPTEEEEEEDEE